MNQPEPDRGNDSPSRARSLSLVVMGTGPFAVPTFEALVNSPHRVLGLLTRPDRAVHGRPRQSAPRNPMREAARQRGIEVFEPESINAADAHERLRGWNADLFVVCDYGQILASETLATARLGGINLHGSLLPRYRGAAPIQWAIFHGETETGVSVIHMTPRLDAGPVLVQERLAIEPNETAGQLEPRLAALGPGAVFEAIELLAAGKIEGIPQNPSQSTKAPRLKKTDGLVDWRRSAEEIRNQVRAMDPWPKAYTFVPRGEGQPLRVILDAVAVESIDASIPAGMIIAADTATGSLVVACGREALAITRLQPEGRRSMSSAEFLRGYPIHAGERLGA
jgi:methionyl-tRNA formyltransferase